MRKSLIFKMMDIVDLGDARTHKQKICAKDTGMKNYYNNNYQIYVQ